MGIKNKIIKSATYYRPFLVVIRTDVNELPSPMNSALSFTIAFTI